MAKKTTKLEQLEGALAIAKAHLAAEEARLRPLIVAEEVRVAKLHKAAKKAEKAVRAAFSQLIAEEEAVTVRLFPPEQWMRLLAAIKEHVARFPEADIERLAMEYRRAQVRIAGHNAYEEHARAAKAANTAWSAYNVATGRGGELYLLTSKLKEATDAVRRLEKEIERLPLRREAARDRRVKEHREMREEEQTEAARALMADFVFAPTQVA